MANEIFKELKTRIALKTLDLAGWEAIKETYKPLKGEVCICEIPAGNNVPTANSVTPPTVLFKVGDGVNFWKDLNWASALAADVYGWAKQASLPVERAANDGTEGNVISSIKFENNKVVYTTASVATSEGMEALQKEINDNRDAWAKDDNDNTTYQFSIPASGNDKGKLLVEKKEIGETTWTKVGAYDFVTPGELTETLKDYYTKDDLNGKIHTEEEIKAMEIAHATAAGKVDKTLTVKVGGETKTFNGSADVEADVDSAISGAIGELGALASKDKVVEGDIEGTISKDKITNFATEVAAVKVSEADTADKVAHSFTVNGVVFNGLEDKSIIIDAASLGLDTVMHFIGAFATAPTKAFAGASNERDLANGDVYLNTANATEYVYSNSKWVELGNEEGAGSHALKTITITGTDGLTGGGSLEQNRTISHAVPSNATEGDHKGSNERTYITNVKTDKFGHVVDFETGTETDDGILSVQASGDAEVSLNAVEENGTVTITAAHTAHAAGEAKTASAATIADYDGTGTIKIPKIVTNAAGHVTEISEETVTITMPSRQEIPEASGNATIASVSGDVVTLKTSAVLNADHTLTNGDGEDITLAKVAKTGSAYDLAEANVGTDKDGNEVFYLVLDCNW